MKQWEQVKLGEIADFTNGGAWNQHEYTESGVPVVRVSDIQGGTVVTKKMKYLSPSSFEKYKNHVLFAGDLVIGTVGSHPTQHTSVVGKHAIIPQELEGALLNQNAVRISPLDNDILDKNFLGLLGEYREFKNYIARNARGSANQSRISISSLKQMPINLPDIETQQAISSILDTLLKKIRLNQGMNKNLEEMAMTLYKYWFVDFGPFQDSEFVESEAGLIPKGWEFRTIKEITAKFCTGLNPRKNFILGEGTNYYVTIKNIINNQVILNEKCDKITDEAIKKINKRSDLRKGDLLFSGIGTIGRVHYIDEEPENWNISESIFTLRNNDAVSDLFLYLTLLSPELQSYAYKSASGSVQKGVRKKDLESYKVRVPEKKVMNLFTNKVGFLLKQIKTNEKENQQLVNMRDYLIPKLLSGEINLSKAQEKGNVLQ